MVTKIISNRVKQGFYPLPPPLKKKKSWKLQSKSSKCFIHFLFLCFIFMSFVCYLYVIVCHLYVIHISYVRDSYVLVCHLYFTRIASVCHRYVFVCHPYVTHMYLHVIRIPLVCTSMSFVWCLDVILPWTHVMARVIR